MKTIKQNFDVIIIGSGASGSVISHYLVNEGLNICLVEKGEELNIEDAPSQSFDWESKKRKKYSFNPNVRKNKADYQIDCTESPIEVANFNGLGGSTALFSAHYPRFHESDFMTKTIDNVGVDWPISYNDLKEHYAANEKFLGVSGLPGDPVYPDRMSHLNPPIPIGNTGEIIAKAFNKKKWHWWPSYSAILNQNNKHRERCRNIGACNTGCPNGAKSSADVTFIRESLKKGLTLFKNTTALSIELTDKKIKGLICNTASGEKILIRSKKIVLAANAIGTLRILWNSSDKKNFLANSSGQIGKNFMIHPLGYVEGYIEDANDAHIGPQGSWIASHEFYKTDLSRDFSRGFTMHLLKNIGPSELTFNYLLRKKIKNETKISEFVKKRIAGTIGIATICEDLPEEKNRIIMKDNSNTPDLLPQPKVIYELSNNTKKMISFGMSRSKEILKLAGAKDIYGSGPIRFAGWHLTGTTKMGNNPSDSVVNKFGECHDIRNLYIADGGVFPTSSSVNPAATIQAVARYIAKNIAHEFK